MNHSHTAIAIFAGFCVIGAAIYFKEGPTPAAQVTGQPAAPVEYGNPTRADKAHIYGNVNAPTRIIEFSDFQCTFCARLHPTLKRLVDESGGQIAWEYRHLPLPNHPQAFTAAVASECVANELGNDAFWVFSEILLANLQVLNETFFVSEAVKLGASQADFISCLEDSAMSALVQADLEIARDLGANGTPFSVVVRDGQGEAISGALPYEQWVSILGS